jgi:hypothetical protein
LYFIVSPLGEVSEQSSPRANAGSYQELPVTGTSAWGARNI